MGAELEVVHGFIEARCQTLVRRAHRARVPERRRDREPAHRGRAREGRDGHRERRPRAGGHRPRRVPQPHGRAGRRRRVRRRSRSKASTSLAPVDSEIMGDRIEAGTLLMACGIAGGEVTIEGTRLEHLEMVVLKLGEMGLDVSPTPDGLWARCDEPAAGGRRGDAAVPRLRDRLHAARRWRCSPPPTARAIVTENMFDSRFGFVDELAPHGRRRAHRGPPRRGPGRRAPVRARPCGPTTCAPAPRWCSPASPPTARPGCSTRTTSTGATPTSPASSGRWAPTSDADRGKASARIPEMLDGSTRVRPTERSSACPLTPTPTSGKPASSRRSRRSAPRSRATAATSSSTASTTTASSTSRWWARAARARCR